MRKSSSGFTIVELLIVIVVIAILATISIVAYNGIQNRAYNAKVIAGTQAYYKAFLNFKSINDSYPSTSRACLGANYPNNACWAANANGTSPSDSISGTLDTALSEFIPNKPELSTVLLYNAAAGPTQQYRAGLIYIPGDVTYGYRLSYYLKGNSIDCGLPVAARLNEGSLTQCIISLPN